MEIIHLGKYTLIEKLGQGGFGTVYKAEDPIGRMVVVKVLKPGWADDPEALERFRREALAAGTLFHRNIATILDMDEVEGRRFIVMRYVDGQSLDQMLKENGPLPWEKVLEITRQVADALDYAHESGFIHRDVKPSNILISKKDDAVLTDFGLVRAAASSGFSSKDAVVGTPNYIAPEIWRGKPPASSATDLYSLACVVYEMVTGQVLFDGDSTPVIITKHVLDGFEFPEEWPEGIPDGFTEVLGKALEKSPEDRWADAAAFADALEKLEGDVVETEDPPKQTKPAPEEIQQKKEPDKPKPGMKRVGVVVMALALIGLVVWGVSQLLDVGTQTSTRTREKDMMEMVNVPAGEFWMGSEADDLDADEDEFPQHKVNLEAYWIDKTEVTNAQYAVFLNEMGNQMEGGTSWLDARNVGVRVHTQIGGWQADDGYADHPVVRVSWYGANAYCEWAGGKLPTEAEWEKAARGTAGLKYPWGNDSLDCQHAQYGGCQGGGTSPVGSLKAGASPYGALDMAGNVWEWTRSLYHDYPFDPNRWDPPTSSGRRLVRGGSWINDGDSVRTANRLWIDPGYASDFGFRCVVSAAVP